MVDEQLPETRRGRTPVLTLKGAMGNQLIVVVEVHAVDVLYDSVVGPERCTRLGNMPWWSQILSLEKVRILLHSLRQSPKKNITSYV